MMTIVENVIQVLIGGVLTMLLFAVGAWFQRRKAQARDGWYYLTPAPLLWATLVLGLGMTGTLNYIYFFVGSARHDAESQMFALLLLVIAFDLMTLAIAYALAVEQVRWNATRIERKTLLFTWRGMDWIDLAEAGEEISGYLWVSAQGGRRIRFVPYSNGCEQLMSKIAEHFPDDEPPDDTQAHETAGAAPHVRR